MTKKLFAVSLAFILALFTVIPAFAQTDTSVSGTVLSVDTTTGTFQIGTEAGDTLTVTPPAGFDLTTLTVGGTVEVQGSLDATNLTATSVVLVPEDGTEEEGKVNKGFYCTTAESSQPALADLASEFNADYAHLLDWFCSGHYGVGEIMLALRTSQAMEGLSAQEILDMRGEGGWGKVWQELGLIGHGHNRDEDVTEGETEVETEDENENSPADAANEHTNNGNGQSGEHGNSGGNGKGHKNGNGKGH